MMTKKFIYLGLAAFVLSGCGGGYRETRSASNIVKCSLNSSKVEKEVEDSWLRKYVEIISCKAVSRAGFPQFYVTLKNVYKEGVSIEYRVESVRIDGSPSIEGSSKEWNTVHISPNEEKAINFSCIDKEVTDFKIHFRRTDIVSK
ncbi:MAG: hypothetical protein HY606_05020 [Planctomycetes bacterium]|nr:hypothetical protein [Planctomycetota bacterium]